VDNWLRPVGWAGCGSACAAGAEALWRVLLAGLLGAGRLSRLVPRLLLRDLLLRHLLRNAVLWDVLLGHLLMERRLLRGRLL
jgi:hypothetical protein